MVWCDYCDRFHFPPALACVLACVLARDDRELRDRLASAAEELFRSAA